MSMLDRILAAVNKLQADLGIITLTLLAQGDQLQVNSQKLDRILSILLEPAPIAGAVITLGGPMGSSKKAPLKASVDFQLADNGTATGTISFVDSVGEPTSPVSGATVATSPTSSDPGITVSVDSTGLILTIAPASPLPTPLPTDVIITASITITNPDGSTVGPFTATSQGIDLVAGGPAGASISLS